MSSAAAKQCPKCGQPATDLLRVDPGMRLRVQEVLPDETFPDEICGNCYKALAANVSRGAKLRAEAGAREQNKMMMWRSRVSLVKQGRTLMTRKNYSEAAVSLEKYLRVLEVVYDKKPGELTPEIFKDSARTKEITVIASVLWDLVRIYDTTPRYADRQKKAATKLVSFLQFSPLQGEIIRKARQFEGSAKNKSVIKDLIKGSERKGGRCFIATATYQSPLAYEVMALSSYRDQVLLRSHLGRVFVRTYYLLSPPIARILDQSESLRRLSKAILSTVAPWLDRKYKLKTPTSPAPTSN